MTTLKGQILTLPKMSGSVSAPSTIGGNIGAKTINIGEDGATFIPSVSDDGVISWTNDKYLPNPEPVNIKGVKGDKGDKGDRGLQGIQGVQGIKGETGAQGQKGADGTPATHRWSGTTLYISSASGTSSANLKGDKGDKGDTGATGANGTNGKDGKDGADGYTPAKGEDYFTDSDKAEMVAAVKSQLMVEQWTFTLMDGSTVTKKVAIG